MTAATKPRPTADELLWRAVELLADLLRRVEQCEHVCYNELKDLDDGDLKLLEVKRAITILSDDVDRAGQEALDDGLLDNNGDSALKFTLADAKGGVQ